MSDRGDGPERATGRGNVARAGADARADARADAGADARGGEAAVDVEGRRARIEALDDELLALVSERVRLAREIGAAKRRTGEAKLDPGREVAVIRRAVERGRALGLPEEPVREMFWTLIGLCRGVQLEDRP